MVSQRRYASRRHSSIQAGSFFFAEINRTVSSDRPLGALSDSISVSNPYRYWSTSIRLTRSTVSCTAAIPSSARGFKDRGGSISKDYYDVPRRKETCLEPFKQCFVAPYS